VVSLMLSDIIMPEMNGHQLARLVRQKYPAIKIQLMSGFDDRETKSDSEPEHGPLLYKPFDASSLLQRVRKLLDQDTSKA
jgi:YesN/AraC family two-component response regulator